MKSGFIHPFWSGLIIPVVCFAFFGLRKVTGPGRLNPLWVFLFVYMLINYAGGMIFSFIWFPASHSELLLPKQSSDISLQYFLALNLTLVMLPIGALCANALLQYNPKSSDMWFSVRSEIPTETVPVALMLSLLLLHAAVLVFHLLTVPVIPILDLFLEQDPAKVSVARDLARKGYRYIYPVYVINTTCLTFLTGWVLINAQKRKKVIWWLIFLSFLLIGVLEQLTNITRSGVGLFLMYLLFVSYFSKRCGNLSGLGSLLAKGGIVMLVFPAILTYAKYNPGSILEYGGLLFYGFGFRVFFGQTMPLYYHFACYPYHKEFAGVWGIGTVASLLGAEMRNVGEEVFTFIHPGFYLETATAPAAYPGYLYALGGWPTVVIGSFMVPFVFQALHIAFTRCRRDSLSYSRWLFLCFSALYLNATSPLTVFTSYGIVYPVLYYYALRATGVRASWPWKMEINKESL